MPLAKTASPEFPEVPPVPTFPVNLASGIAVYAPGVAAVTVTVATGA